MRLGSPQQGLPGQLLSHIVDFGVERAAGVTKARTGSLGSTRAARAVRGQSVQLPGGDAKGNTSAVSAMPSLRCTIKTSTPHWVKVSVPQEQRRHRLNT